VGLVREKITILRPMRFTLYIKRGCLCHKAKHEEIELFLFFRWQGSRAGGWSGVAGPPRQQLLLPETFSCLPLLAYVLPFAMRAAAVRAVEKRERK
jgi:hypothetical protein